MLSDLKAVIFDMDGVITHTMPYHYRIWQNIFRREGIHVSKTDVYAREGQQGLQSLIEIFDLHGLPLSLKKAKNLLKEKEILFKKIAKTRFVPGARSFIKECQRKKLRLALVTGTSRHEMETILPQSLRFRFETIVCGDDVRHGKPHPEPYQRALKNLKLSPQRAVVIENAPFGITSAKKAGLTCFALQTSLSKKYLQHADQIFVGYPDMKKVFYGRS